MTDIELVRAALDLIDALLPVLKALERREQASIFGEGKFAMQIAGEASGLGDTLEVLTHRLAKLEQAQLEKLQTRLANAATEGA